MAASFKITTTGTLTPINFPDIGSRSFVHPVVGLDMIATEGYELEELQVSQDIANAIDAGHITVEDAEGNPITSSGDLDNTETPHKLGTHSDVDLTGLSDNDIARYDLATDSWKPEAIPSAPVDSVFGRTGTVAATSGDYDSSEVDYTPSTFPDWDSSADPGQTDDALDQLAARTKLNDAKVSADGSVDTHSDVDTTTVAPTSGDILEWDGSKWVPVAGATMSLFGSEDQSIEDNSEDNSTSITYLETLSLVTTSLPAGDYYIEWYVEQASTSSAESIVRVQVDDTNTEGEISIRSQSVTVFEPNSGWVVSTLTSGIHNIDMDFKSSQSGKTAGVRRRRLRLYRVA